jgi:tight adherence protein B
VTGVPTLADHLRRHGLPGLLVALVSFVLVVPAAYAADDVTGSISDIRIADRNLSASLILRSDKPVKLDEASVRATVGGKPAGIGTLAGEKQKRSTMLVIDTSGSMQASGMATVRRAVRGFLDEVPKDVLVGVVSFASTAGVDVAPTTDHAQVSRAVGALRSGGETSLYQAVQIAVSALGTEGERSIILLSDGGDTVAADDGEANAIKERQAAIDAVTKAKVRAEIISFNQTSNKKRDEVLQEVADAGGGSVADANDSQAVSDAFSDAARALGSQSVLDITLPNGLDQRTTLEITGTASGKPFTVTKEVDLGDTSPVVVPSGGPVIAATAPQDSVVVTAIAPKLLIPAILVLTLGIFLLSVAFMGPVFRSRRAERVNAIDAYGLGRGRPQQQRQAPTASAISEQLVQMGDRYMEGRESTTKTMQLLDRADLPWRAGEWFVLRIVAVVVAAALGYFLLAPAPWIGFGIGALIGFVGPGLGLRFLAHRRTRKFEVILPDVLMLVATSLASGFSLLQALDAVAKDAAEPAAKEFSRALAEARIGADVSDALEHMAERMDSQNMAWAVMAIRIQREVGGNLAETLRTTAATLREREMLRRQVRALSAEGRLSAYILVALPFGLFFYMLWANYDYVSLLWTNVLGWIMLGFGAVSLVIGIFWMRNVVKIEV